MDFFGLEVVRDLVEFKLRSDIVVANRLSNDLIDIKQKIFSRDIFCEN